MKAAIACLPLCLLLQGCVGVDVRNSFTETFPNPRIVGRGPGPDFVIETPVFQTPPFNDQSNLAQYLRNMNQAEVFSLTNVVVYKSAWLEDHWGKPASIIRSGPGGLDEIWTYKFDVIWEGIDLYVIVPIPIMLPVRRETVRFVVRDGRVISATKIMPNWGGGVVLPLIPSSGLNGR
jgi:hypothetical protein